jgi:hypothetical protein
VEVTKHSSLQQCLITAVNMFYETGPAFLWHSLFDEIFLAIKSGLKGLFFVTDSIEK